MVLIRKCLLAVHEKFQLRVALIRRVAIRINQRESR